MKKLFVIYVGGKHSQACIELHDMCFVIASEIEQTYDVLRKKWWGLPSSLHIDAWGILESVENHVITIKDFPQTDQSERLYFVNLGGYDSQQFTELHQNIFVLAMNEQEAKVKAVKQINFWESPHRDNLYDVETLIDINQLTQDNSTYYVHLEKGHASRPFTFVCQYTPI